MNSSRTGWSATCSCFSSSTKVGVSRSRIRMNRASRISTNEQRNGTRQPQLSIAGAGQQVDQGEDERGEQGAGLDADERQRGEEAAAADRRVLGHQHRGTGLLGAGAEALQQAQQHQQDGRPDADRSRRSGSSADRGGGPAHQHDGDDEHPLAAELGRRGRPKNSPPNGRASEADAEGRERGDRGHARVALREEQHVEDQRGGEPVEREVEVLQRASDAGGQRRAAADSAAYSGSSLFRRVGGGRASSPSIGSLSDGTTISTCWSLLTSGQVLTGANGDNGVEQSPGTSRSRHRAAALTGCVSRRRDLASAGRRCAIRTSSASAAGIAAPSARGGSPGVQRVQRNRHADDAGAIRDRIEGDPSPRSLGPSRRASSSASRAPATLRRGATRPGARVEQRSARRSRRRQQGVARSR